MKYLFTWLILLCTTAAIGQSIEELEQSLAATSDAQEVKNLQINLSQAYYNKGIEKYRKGDFSVAEGLLLNSAKYSNLSENLKGESQAYNVLGNVCIGAKKFEKSVTYFNKSLEILAETNDDKGLASAYNNIGITYKKLNKPDEALYYFLESIKIKERINDRPSLSISYYNIANYYKDQDKLDDARVYLLKAVENNKTLGNRRELARSHELLAEVNKDLKKPKIALNNYFKALYLYKALGNPDDMERIRKQIDKLIVGNPSMAITEADTSESNNLPNEKNSKPSAIVAVYENEANTTTKPKSLKEFIKRMGKTNDVDIEKSLELVQKQEMADFKSSLPSNAEEVKVVISDLKSKADIANKKGDMLIAQMEYAKVAEVYEDQGDYQSALEYYKRSDLVKDSLMKVIRKQNLDTIQLKSENDKRIRTFAGIGVSMALITGFLFFLYRNKRKANKVLAEKNNEIRIEKDRSEELLLNILPAETAHELKTYGKSEAKKYDEVSVLFTDFKGFTNIAEQLGPEELVRELDYCFQAFDRITTKHKVEKIKTIGDAYLCAAGLSKTVVSRNPTLDLVKASIEMRNFMLKYKMDRIASNRPYFEARIGIHTGPLVAGIVGVKKFAYDIWGDTVNIAARMEQSGEVGKINISEMTFTKVKDYFNFEPRGKIEAKNKGQIEMYFIEN